MKPRHYLILFLGWMSLIWVLSSLPSEDLPSIQVIGVDKVAHILVYLIWGIFGAIYLKQIQAKCGLSSLIFALMFLLAALDEYHQEFIPGRQVSIYDLLANWLGLLLAYGAFHLIIRKRR